MKKKKKKKKRSKRNVTTRTKEIKPLPETGSFPGYRQGAKVFNAFAQALFDQSSVWNETWGKFKGKKFKVEDGWNAVYQSAQASAEAIDEMFNAFVSRDEDESGSRKKNVKRGKGRRKG